MEVNRLPENLEAWLGISLAAHLLLAVLLILWWGGAADQAGSGAPLLVTLTSPSSSPHPSATGAAAVRDLSPHSAPDLSSAAPPRPVSVPSEQSPAALPQTPATALLPAKNTAPLTVAAAATGAAETTSADPAIDATPSGAQPFSNLADAPGPATSGLATGGSYSPPSLLQRREPVYPTTARAKGWEGTVKLAVTVGTDGRPDRIVIAQSSSYAELDRSALQAARAWRFAPASRGGLPQEETVHIPVEFRLVRGEP